MSHRFRLDPGHVQAFARAVGARVPVAGEVVPPTFMTCSSQDDPAHMRGLRPAGPLAGLGETVEGVLHAEQHFEYFAPARVGDEVEVSEKPGRSWVKQGSSGQLEFLEFVKEVRDADGELVQRSTMTLVRAGDRT